MAHELFEDAGVAALMNEHFINIKVGREERPDLDQIYQSAHYLLTMFLSPYGTPFFDRGFWVLLQRTKIRV